MKNQAIHPHWLIINLYIALSARCFIFWITVANFFLSFCLLETIVLAASGELPVIPRYLKVIDQLAQPCQFTGLSACDSYLIAPAAFQSFFPP